jgi:putative peptidoglycan lipid II flippase
VPATLGLIVLATPIVALLFEHGSFTAAATAGTSDALVFYAPGLIGYSVIKLAVPAFYALHDSRTPVAVGALSVVFNIAVNLALVRVLGVRGLALGTAASALFNATLLVYLLRRRLGGLDGRRIGLAFLKVLGAALFMAAAAWGTERALAGALPGPSLAAKLVRVTVSIGVGLVGLAAAARALRIAEFDEAWRAVMQRILPTRGD